MDKRYYLILIIIFVCLLNLQIIVNNSNEVGSASVSAGRYLFSIPNGFSLYGDSDNSAYIQNADGLKIYFESYLRDSDTYNMQLNYIDNETSDKILSEGTINIENISVNVVYFQTTNNTNKSIFYFEKDEVPFKIVMSGFNYNTDRDLTIDYVTLIIKSTRFDFKAK